MTKTAAIKRKTAPASLLKSATGIQGLDEVSGGGLPAGRPTLVCGGAGCGKTLLAMEFLVRGAVQYGEPGVFMAFEETAEELTNNVRSLGFDLDNLTEQKQLVVDYVHVERSEIEETGEYDLEGLFIRLGHAIDSIEAKRVVLDTIETLFSGLSNTTILRAELRRLFRWLREKGVTAIVTAERGEGTLTRHGLEEYVSDCVILLDHRVNEQISTRRLRIVKYRGTTHGCNEYPFLIDENGISVLPITSLILQHEASSERISTGISRLDAMLGGEGFFRGSSILISGTAGTGKTSLAAHAATASCQRNERCVYFAFEESASQLIRNLKSIGLDLEPFVKKELLRFHNARPTMYGLEMHLATMHKVVEEFQPRLVVVDPISNFMTAGNVVEAGMMLMRLVDFLKSRQTTALFTSLTHGGASLEQTLVDADKPALADMVAKAGTQPAQSELKMCRGDDGLFPAELLLNSLPFRGALCLLVTDLTQQKQTEELKRVEAALRESEERLAAEVEALSRLHTLSTRLVAVVDVRAALDDLLENSILSCEADFGNIQLFNYPDQCSGDRGAAGFSPRFPRPLPDSSRGRRFGVRPGYAKRGAVHCRGRAVEPRLRTTSLDRRRRRFSGCPLHALKRP
jgi:circadian clock protein KaiC